MRGEGSSSGNWVDGYQVSRDREWNEEEEGGEERERERQLKKCPTCKCHKQETSLELVGVAELKTSDVEKQKVDLGVVDSDDKTRRKGFN